MASEAEVKLALGTLVLSASQMLALLIGLAFSVIIARLLGPENYGLVGVSLTYPMLLASLLDLGTSSILVKYAALPRQDRSAYVWSVASFRFFLGLVGFAANYVLADYFAMLLARPYIADYIRILSVYIFALIALDTVRLAFTGLARYTIAGSITIFQYVIRGLIAVYLILQGYGVKGAVLSYSLTYALMCVAYLVAFMHAFGKPAFSLYLLREALAMALPLYASSLAGILIGPYVSTLLARHVSNFDIGNYNVGSLATAPISALIASISTAALTALSPIEQGNELTSRTQRIVAYSSLVASFLVAGYAAVLPPLVYIMYSRSYRDAPLYALVLLVGHFVNAFTTGGVLGSFFVIAGQTKWNLVAGLAGAITIIASSTILIPVSGALGAALAYACGSAVSAITTYAIARKVFLLDIPIRKVLRGVAPAILGFAIAILAARTVLVNISLPIQLLLLGVIYLLAHLSTLPVFVSKSALRDAVAFASKLPYIGVLIKPFGELYLKLLRVE